jgi:hypothetical protein
MRTTPERGQCVSCDSFVTNVACTVLTCSSRQHQHHDQGADSKQRTVLVQDAEPAGGGGQGSGSSQTERHLSTHLAAAGKFPWRQQQHSTGARGLTALEQGVSGGGGQSAQR